MSETDSKNSTTEEKAATMTDSVPTSREHVRHISTTLPEIDGQKINPIRFLSSLRIADLTKGDQEPLAVEGIKT